MQKLAEEKKAEALKQMNSMPQVELDLKRHDGYHCRDGRMPPQNSSMSRQHPKQVGQYLINTIYSLEAVAYKNQFNLKYKEKNNFR